MQPTIIDKDQMVLLGFSFFGDPFEFSAGWTEENEIGQLWRRLMAYLEKHAGRIQHAGEVGAGEFVDGHSVDPFAVGLLARMLGYRPSDGPANR